jgi:hypothetical protein
MFLIGSYLSHHPFPFKIQIMARTTSTARKTTGGTAPRKEDLNDLPATPTDSDTDVVPASDKIGKVSKTSLTWLVKAFMCQ